MVVVEAGAAWGYTRDVGLRCSHVWGGDALRIIHPTDPTCNTATYKVERVEGVGGRGVAGAPWPGLHCLG